MEKLDLRQELKHLYSPQVGKVHVVNVPPLQFAMIDGEVEPGGSPGESPAFQAAVEALYGVSYTLKFASKQRRENPIDYSVMALEGLWWMGEGRAFDFNDLTGWRWTAMILQPEHIGAEMFAEALAQQRKKKDNPALNLLRLETFHEGLSLQMMHVGPYSEERATLEKMEAFALENGYSLRGKHHEIYLGDPRRADPAKLKTVLRHPVQKTA